MKSNKHFMELWNLMQENPDLPIVPMVSGDILGDEFHWWLGSWRHSQVNQYVCGDITGQVYFKGDDDPETVISDIFEYCHEWGSMTDEQMITAYNNLPWQKCIVVYIDI